MNRSVTAAAHTGAAERLLAEPLPVASPLRVHREAAPPFSLAVLLALATLLGPAVSAQPVVRPIIASTVATLPAGASTGAVRLVTDGASASDCATGGGTTYVWCVKTGAGWVAFGDGGAGGSGDVTSVGDCSTGACFQATTATHAFMAPVGGGVAAFRAITDADVPNTITVDLATLATTATALAANGGNCTAGSYPRGVDASGAAEGCTADDDVPEDADLGTGTADGTTFLRGDRTWAVPSGGGGSPAGSGSELQYRSDATTFGAVTGSSVSGGAVTLAGTLSIDPDAANGYDFQARMDGGIARFEIRDRAAGANMERWQIEGGGDSSNGILTFGLLNDAASSWTAQHVLRLIAGGTNRVDINGDLRKTGDSNTGVTWSTTDVVGLTAGGVYGISQSTTETTLAVEQINSPASQTCTDEGTGAAGALTVAVSGTSNVEVTNSDAHGCAATLSETGATRGQALTVSNVSNAGGTIDFTDAAGVQETGAGCSLGLYGVAVFRFISDRWLLASCQPTN